MTDLPFDLTVERLNRGLSIRGLARECQVHEATLRSLESGKQIHPASAKRIADFFGVKVTDLEPFREVAGA